MILSAPEYLSSLLLVVLVTGCASLSGPGTSGSVAFDEPDSGPCIDRFWEQCVRLGLEAEHGEGIADPDPRKARVYYQRGCNHEVAESCYRLGALFESGVRSRRLEASMARETVKTYQKACRMDHPGGCGAAARLHFGEFGGEQNYMAALRWAREGCVLEELDGEELTETMRQGQIEACVILGRLHARGRAVSRDEGKAVELLSAACERVQVHQAGGCEHLGDLYAGGPGDREPDLQRAAEAWSKGCEAGEGLSCCRLARLLQDDGQEVNAPKDASWYRSQAITLGEACPAGSPPPSLPE